MCLDQNLAIDALNQHVFQVGECSSTKFDVTRGPRQWHDAQTQTLDFSLGRAA